MVRVTRTEEKGSDVSLATALVADAYEGDFDVAVVITNDSDQVAPIRLVTERLGQVVGLIIPRLEAANQSAELKAVASFDKVVRPIHLQKSLFSFELRDAVGRFSCPAEWR